MILSESTKSKIKSNRNLRRDLMAGNDISEYTLLKWLRENSKALLELPNLTIISQHLEEDIESMVIYQEGDFKPVI